MVKSVLGKDAEESFVLPTTVCAESNKVRRDLTISDG